MKYIQQLLINKPLSTYSKLSTKSRFRYYDYDLSTDEKKIAHAFHSSGYMFVHSGFPDLFIVKDGKYIWVEIKKNKRSVISSGQIETMKLLTSLGMECYIYFMEEKEIIPINTDMKIRHHTSCLKLLRNNKPNKRVPKHIIYALSSFLDV